MKINNFKIFIVEDDPWYANILKHHLDLNPEYDLELFESGKELLNNIYKFPDLICVDFGLPDMTGHKLLQEIHKHNKNIPVIVISAQEEIDVAVELLKAGAVDYITKGDHAKEQLWKSIIQIRENIELRNEVEQLKSELGEKYSFENSIVGQSEAMKQTYSFLHKAIESNINVSLTGETGTGKEVFAKAIHYNGERRKKPFIAVNMSAIPKELIESELFGHEKGAFTGAIDTKKGKFEEAQGGTLFLDEIGELDLTLQSKLLRVIQERELIRVGGHKAIKIDIRLITATNKTLSKEVRNGNFREDLFFRIVGLPIELPPLRSRGNDIIILAKHFIDEFSKLNKTKKLALSETAKLKLRKYPWPGNVRELKAVIDLACVMTDNNTIKAEDLSFYQITDAKPYSDSEKTLKEFEVEIILNYLKKYNKNVLLVAEKLNIGKSKIYQILKQSKSKFSNG